jgi:hypothetical protein
MAQVFPSAAEVPPSGPGRNICVDNFHIGLHGLFLVPQKYGSGPSLIRAYFPDDAPLNVRNLMLSTAR